MSKVVKEARGLAEEGESSMVVWSETVEKLCQHIEKLEEKNHYLNWFWKKSSSAFGPADADIYAMYEEQYEIETGRKPLTRYRE